VNLLKIARANLFDVTFLQCTTQQQVVCLPIHLDVGITSTIQKMPSVPKHMQSVPLN
jgi:hypothetical protein